MARKRYTLFGRKWFHSRLWTRVVPKGTRGAQKGYMSRLGLVRGLDEIWLKPHKRPVHRAVWRLKQRRRDKWF